MLRWAHEDVETLHRELVNGGQDQPAAPAAYELTSGALKCGVRGVPGGNCHANTNY